MFSAFPSPNNCFYPVAHKSSYGDTLITYKIKGGGPKTSVSGKYSVAFTEKTNGEMGIACSSERTCWVACECQSDWSTSAPSGEYVYAKDDRYANGLSSMSANGSLSSMSANGNLSTMSGNYSISTMAANGGMTCYKKACPNGGYLDEPGSAFTKSRSDGTLGLDCWNATGCSSYYASNASGTKYEYHGTVCYRKTCADGGYSDKTQSGKHCSQVSYAGLQCYDCHTPDYYCPSGYQSSSCGTGYTQTGTTSKKCKDCSATSGTCYKCEQNEIYWPDVYNIDSFSVIKTETHCEISGAESASLEYSKGGSYYKGYSASDFRIIGVTGTKAIVAGFTKCSSFNPKIGELEWQGSYYVYKKDLSEISCQCSDFGSAFPVNGDDFKDSILYVTLKHEPTGETKEVELMME